MVYRGMHKIENNRLNNVLYIRYIFYFYDEENKSYIDKSITISNDTPEFETKKYMIEECDKIFSTFSLKIVYGISLVLKSFENIFKEVIK